MRYLVFAGDHYYPLGGWDDLVLATDDVALALAEAVKWADKSHTWVQVVDLGQGRVIWREHPPDGEEPAWASRQD